MSSTHLIVLYYIIVLLHHNILLLKVLRLAPLPDSLLWLMLLAVKQMFSTNMESNFTWFTNYLRLDLTSFLTVKWPGIILQILFSSFNILYCISLRFAFALHIYDYFLCIVSHTVFFFSWTLRLLTLCFDKCFNSQIFPEQIFCCLQFYF